MNFKKLILYSSVFSIQGLSNAAIPVLPELAGGVGDSVVSNLLFSGYFVGALLALVPFGILADRIGNLKVIGFGVLLTALSGLVISFSDSLWILVIARFLEGVGCGAFFPAAFSLLAGWKDSQRSLGEFNFLLNRRTGCRRLSLWDACWIRNQNSNRDLNPSGKSFLHLPSVKNRGAFVFR